MLFRIFVNLVMRDVKVMWVTERKIRFRGFSFIIELCSLGLVIYFKFIIIIIFIKF